MGKDRNKKDKQKSVPLQASQGFSAEEWSHIIAKAIEEAEQNQRAEVAKRREEDRKAWQKTIGFRDYSNLHGPKRWVLEIFNVLITLLKTSFVPRSKVRGDRMTLSLLQMISSTVFATVDWVLLAVAIAFIAIPPISVLAGRILAWWQVTCSVLLGILIFFVSRLFRIASIELEMLEDRSYLLGICACIVSIISLVVTLVGR